MAYQLVQDYLAPGAESINHAAEICTWTFELGPEQMPGQSQIRNGIIQAHKDELIKQGSQVLRIRVWEDTSPTFTTRYKVESTATASPLIWGVLIAGILVVLALAFITFSISEIKKIIWGPNGEGGITGDIKDITKWLVLGAVAVTALVVVSKRSQ